MKKNIYRFFILLVSVFAVVNCGKKEHLNEQNIQKLEYAVEWKRFDEAFTNLNNENFDEVQRQFPMLLHKGVSKEIWLQKKNDSLFQEICNEVANKFTDLSKIQKEVNEVLKRTHYYFPEDHPNKVITLISEVDVKNQVVYTDSLVLISLDTYLGEKHKYYSVFDAYLLRNHSQERITVDVSLAVATHKVPFQSSPSFLDGMITEGKKLLVLDSLMPQLSDTLKFNYTQKELEWAEVNEEQIWRYFMEQKMLYDHQPKLFQRFLLTAPFSKFYMSFDRESPGRIGVYMGYQMVKAFQDKKQLPLKKLIATDNALLFKESNYKPKK